MDQLETKLREILAEENGEQGVHVTGDVSSNVCVAAMRRAYLLGMDSQLAAITGAKK